MRFLGLSPQCLLCDVSVGPHQRICSDCADALPRVDISSCCPRCGCFSPAGKVCWQCIRYNPAYDATIAAFWYTELIAKLVHQFKYHANFLYGQLLADEFLRRHVEVFASVDVLVPVPLHWRRQIWRGYNQSSMLASWLSKYTGIPVVHNQVRRLIATKHQTQLLGKQRYQNMLKAFAVSEPLSHGSIAIIDDVMTTGATAHHLANILKSTGAHRVTVICMSRSKKIYKNIN